MMFCTCHVLRCKFHGLHFVSTCACENEREGLFLYKNHKSNAQVERQPLPSKATISSTSLSRFPTHEGEGFNASPWLYEVLTQKHNQAFHLHKRCTPPVFSEDRETISVCEKNKWPARGRFLVTVSATHSCMNV